MFAVELATNLEVPDVTVDAGLLCMVDVTVSRVLAVKYVPPYNIHIRANGFEKMRLWGRRIKLLSDDRRDSLSVA